MNRHQSNPFLADWDEEPAAAAGKPPSKVACGSIFDDPVVVDQQQAHHQDNKSVVNATTRRHSSSSSDVSQRGLNERRSLYHRNMSSFEAASLHQQLQENGSATGDANNDFLSSELIAKMTAEFKSAMESKEKEFQLNDDQQQTIEGFNPFDPFETIVDDDISYPSPGIVSTSSANANNDNNNNSTTTPKHSQQQQQHHGQQVDKQFFNDSDNRFDKNDIEPEVSENEEINKTRKIKEDLDLPMDSEYTKKQTHDSIDDDDDELISTPVRNIKSIQTANIMNESLSDDAKQLAEQHQATSAAFATETNKGHNQQQPFAETTNEESNSIEKAHLYASLLDSAENQAKIDTVYVAENESGIGNQVDDCNNSKPSQDSASDYARVIKGSPTALDGSMDRPVGYFDPFETVIDKDALTSLCNQDNVKPTTGAHGADSPTNNETNFDQANDDMANKPEVAADNHSNEANTTTSTTNERSTTSTTTTSSNNLGYCAIPRPKPRQIDPGSQQATPQATPIRRAPKSTPIKQRNKHKAKHFGRDANQDDASSSSSSEDEHLKIVIKAREPPGSAGTAAARATTPDKPDEPDNAEQQQPILVPLLPPPPSRSSLMQSGALETPSRRARRKSSSSSSDSSIDETKLKAKKDGLDSASDAKDKVTIDAEIDAADRLKREESSEDEDENDGRIVIGMTQSDEEELDANQINNDDDEPLYDHDTTYKLEDFSEIYQQEREQPSISGWKMLLRYPPKKKFTSNRFWKEIAVRVEEVPLAPPSDHQKGKQQQQQASGTCFALQVFNKLEEKKPMQEIPLQPTYTISDISSQQFDQFGKLFTIKLQYVFYKERVGVRQGQLARFIHGSGTSTTSGGHGIDPLSVGAIKRLGAPVEHSPQISQIIKLGSTDYADIKQFKSCLEDHLFKMPIQRQERALTNYKTEEIQMLVRDETYIELNQIGQITRQLARVRLFFLSFLNGQPTIEVGVNDVHRQGREVVGRMDILPVITEEWIRLEACELHSTVDKEEFENPESRLIKFTPPDATFFELMRFRVRPPRNRELPLQISANMSVTKTKVVINVDCVVAGSVSRKMGPIPCENIAIRIALPDCWIYQFREEKHFRMGSKKSVKNTPGRIKGMGRFLGGTGPPLPLGNSPLHSASGSGPDNHLDNQGVIEVTSGQAKYEHHHKAIVWRAAKWPKDNQTAYVRNSIKIYLTLTAYDQMPSNFYEYVHVEYNMPATTISHTSLRSISVNPCDDEPPEKFVKYLAKYEYKCKMRLSVDLKGQGTGQQSSIAPHNPVISSLLKRDPDRAADLQREEDSDDDDDDDDDDDNDVTSSDRKQQQQQHHQQEKNDKQYADSDDDEMSISNENQQPH